MKLQFKRGKNKPPRLAGKLFPAEEWVTIAHTFETVKVGKSAKRRVVSPKDPRMKREYAEQRYGTFRVENSKPSKSEEKEKE